MMTALSLQTMAQKSKKVLKLSFKNHGLLAAALTHPSYLNENPVKVRYNFDRLEFFGDAILNYVICRKLYRLFPDYDEGMLSRLRSILVSRRVLFRIAKETGFYKLVLLSRGLQNQPLATKAKIFADAFEALLGAFYLDQNLAKTEKFILTCFHDYFDAKRLFRIDPNPKSTLQEITQRRWQRLPVYQTQSLTSGKIKVIVTVGRNCRAAADAKTRQEAEEKAARLLIQKIRKKKKKRN